MKKSISITITSDIPFKIVRPGEKKYTQIQNFHFSSKIQAITLLKEYFDIDLTDQDLKQKGTVNKNNYQVYIK